MTVVSCSVDERYVNPLFEVFDGGDFILSSYRDVEDVRTTMQIFFPDSADAPRAVAPTGHTLLLKDSPGASVDRVAQLLARGRRAVDDKGVRNAAAAHQVLHDVLGHGAAAYVAVADEEHAYGFLDMRQRLSSPSVENKL